MKVSAGGQEEKRSSNLASVLLRLSSSRGTPSKEACSSVDRNTFGVGLSSSLTFFSSLPAISSRVCPARPSSKRIGLENTADAE